MAKNLDGLVALVDARKRDLAARKCITCRNREIAAELDRALGAAIANPAKYAGLSVPALWEWCGAKAAGIGQSALRMHLVGHRPELWAAFNEKAK